MSVQFWIAEVSESWCALLQSMQTLHPDPGRLLTFFADPGTYPGTTVFLDLKNEWKGVMVWNANGGSDGAMLDSLQYVKSQK
eukprot:108080-Rhodomonas_salina.1